MGVKRSDKSVKQNNMNTVTQDNYKFYKKGGQCLVEQSPVFSPDGESLAVIVENVVRVYNIHTGDYVRTLETETPVDELIAIQFPEDENYNLYGCSSKGKVTVWTWEQGVVLREVKLHIPKEAQLFTFNLLDSQGQDCVVTFSLPNKKTITLTSHSTKTGQLVLNYKDTTAINTGMVRVSLGVCNGEKYAAIVNNTAYLFIQNLQQPHIQTQIRNFNGYRIMSVSAHKREDCVAITDTLGRTTLIRGNLYDHRNQAKEVLHWHFLPPLASCFSLEGNYLYTGGIEKVLVKWTLGNLAYRSDEKAFIPRLPGVVRFIAANSTHVAASLTNNSIVIADPQLHVTCTILECGGVSPAARAVGGTLVYHNTMQALITAGRPGHLQLVSTATDKVLFNLDITQKNSLPPERWDMLPLETEVTCAAVSSNGDWLVTSEYRNDGVFYPEEKLKFWSAARKAAVPFRLNTCVNLSHGGCNVVSLAFNYQGDICVSAGTDQKFRIWKKDSSETKTVSWMCLTACYYSSGIGQFIANTTLNDFKDGTKFRPADKDDLPYLQKPTDDNDIIKKVFNLHKGLTLVEKDDGSSCMGGVGVSQDGSLIAAWFGCKLTLWDTHLHELRTTLAHPMLRPKGLLVNFGSKGAAHFLACTTQECLAVWNLLSLTIKWIVKINPVCLTSHRFTSKMAVTTANNDVYVFLPSSSNPILTKKRLLDPKTGVIKQCTFGTCTDNDVTLYLMRNNSEIYCLEKEITEENKLEVLLHRSLPTSNFSALLAVQQLSEVQSATAPDVISVNNLATSTIAQFSLAAPHMVPPVDLLSTTFLERLSGMELPQEDEPQEEKPLELDEDSSEDEDSSPKLNGPIPRITDFWTPNYDVVKEKRLTKIKNEPFIDLHSTSSLFEI